MEVVSYDPLLLGEVTAAYNELVIGTPYCYAVTPELFGRLVPAAEGSPLPELQSEHMLVAREGGEVLGFIHCGTASELWQRDSEARPGAIRFLCQRPGHRLAGMALLRAGEDWLRERGAGMILAFHQDCNYPFYHLVHAYASDRLGHIIAVLGANGYHRSHGEVYLQWSDFPRVDPGPPPDGLDLDLAWGDAAGSSPVLVVDVRKGGEQVAQCRNCTCGAEFRPPEAGRWFITNWLGVDESLRGRGLGKYLLARARFEMHARGYRSAIISTSSHNYRALLFYSNEGYRVTDWTYGFTKKLT